MEEELIKTKNKKNHNYCKILINNQNIMTKIL